MRSTWRSRCCERGIKVAIGGFHVSGTMSMLGGDDAGIHQAKAMGVSLFAGEAEGRLEQVLQDAFAGTLKPLYNFMADLPGIEGMPIPLITAVRAARTAGHMTSFDAGRGCPFQCSFCTIINVQGRKSRRRSPDDIEKIIRANVAQGLRSFFITDDNFARNKDWEAILDRIIWLREVEKLKLGFLIQVDTLCHKLPNFVEKCARAGVRRVFIGLENINPESLAGAHKRQNKITEYRKMLLAWKAARVITYCGYIIGFPNDTPESIKRDVEIVKKELPLDILEFFFLTPLPGSEDHQNTGQGRRRDRSGLEQVRSQPRLRAAFEDVAGGLGAGLPHGVGDVLHHGTHGDGLPPVDGDEGAGQQCARAHDLVHGRDSHREGPSTRERILALEVPARSEAGVAEGADLEVLSEILFLNLTVKMARWAVLYCRLHEIFKRVRKDPKRFKYTDLALTPVTDHDVDDLEMFHNAAAQTFVAQEQRRQHAREHATVA